MDKRIRLPTSIYGWKKSAQEVHMTRERRKPIFQDYCIFHKVVVAFVVNDAFFYVRLEIQRLEQIA